MEFDTLKGMMDGGSPDQKQKKFSTYLQLVNAMEEEEGRTVNIVKFIRDTEDMSREAIQSFAEEQGISVEEIDERLFNMMRSVLKKIGKHNDVPDEEFDPEQLQMGIEVEQEHVDDPLVAKMIAKDHLAEMPDYYTRLVDMENEAGSEMDDFESEQGELFPDFDLSDQDDQDEMGDSEENYDDSETVDDESGDDEMFAAFDIGAEEELDFEDEYDPAEKVHKNDNKKPFHRIS